MGTDERVIIDILCSKKSEEIEQLKKAYAASKFNCILKVI